MQNTTNIIFDLDGTLTDSGKGIVNSYIYVAEQMGVEAPPREVIRRFVGPPVRLNLATFLPADKVEEGVKHYFYSMIDLRRAIDENEVYDGIDALLRKLAESGKALFVATSKRRELSVDIIAHFGWSSLFKKVYGANETGGDAQKELIVSNLLAEQKADSSRTVMIGDRCFDIEGAKINGLRSIGVLWGYGSQDELKEAGADEIAASPDELLVLLG